VALTEVFAPSVTVHCAAVPDAAQLSPHPANTEPDAAVAVSVTVVPLAKVAAQVVPHEIPAGALATAPAPAPCKAIDSVGGGVGAGAGGGGGGGCATCSDAEALPDGPPVEAIARESRIQPGCASASTVAVTAYAGVEAPAASVETEQEIVHESAFEQSAGASPTVQCGPR